MILLDTDHLSELQFNESQAATRLLARIEAAESGSEVATTIITVEELFRGWLAKLKGDVARQVAYYERLQHLLLFFTYWKVLPFDDEAARRFQALRRQGIRRIGEMDLKIASIALVHDATLLSANLAHFRQVPGLKVADWLDRKR